MKIREMLLSGICLLAVELGGFEVYVEPGAKMDVPPEWEQNITPDGDEDFSDSSAETENGNAGGEQLGETASAQSGSSGISGEWGGSDQGNLNEREEFGDNWTDSGGSGKNTLGSEAAETVGIPSVGQEQNYENSQTNSSGDFEEKSPDIRTGYEENAALQETEEDQTENKAPSAMPVSPQPSGYVLPSPAVTGFLPETDWSAREEAPGNLLEVQYWSGRLKKTSRPRLLLRQKGTMEILSFRVNGKEQKWRWHGSGIAAAEEAEAGSLVELAVFTDYSWTLSANRVILCSNTEVSH